MYNKVVILGLGNILLGDEGVGVCVIDELKNRALPDNIELIDGGTSSLDILLSIKNVAKLIIIDALKCGANPGTVYRLGPKDLENRTHSAPLSLHQIGLLETFSLVEKKGNLPEDIVIIGIEPEKIDCGLGLSPSLERKMEGIVSAVLQEAGQLLRV